ncbi:hypothetical protein m4_igs_870 [Acanthamoeba polyphaga mimivirus]|nr:hypothetical protein m4_igs_10 [Acanthamoeba polyphaga mimivirus]UTE96758.1 hypothetical protein m4_igs_870 [Acanthamoeba polyphaga mimivirus]
MYIKIKLIINKLDLWRDGRGVIIRNIKDDVRPWMTLVKNN